MVRRNQPNLGATAFASKSNSVCLNDLRCKADYTISMFNITGNEWKKLCYCNIAMLLFAYLIQAIFHKWKNLKTTKRIL